MELPSDESEFDEDFRSGDDMDVDDEEDEEQSEEEDKKKKKNK
jgi:hypothetical protein